VSAELDGPGRHREGGSTTRLTSAEKKELAELRRRNRQLELENEILKRAACPETRSPSVTHSDRLASRNPANGHPRWGQRRLHFEWTGSATSTSSTRWRRLGRPPVVARRRKELPPHTRWVKIAGAGHIPMFDDPRSVAALLLHSTGPHAGQAIR
jgi:hypothetical protein